MDKPFFSGELPLERKYTMRTLPAAFYVIPFLALVFGGCFFLFPLFFKVLKLPTTFTISARYYMVTLFLGISTDVLLVSFSVSEMLALGISVVIFICGLSLTVFMMRREARRNLSSGGDGDDHSNSF